MLRQQQQQQQLKAAPQHQLKLTLTLRQFRLQSACLIRRLGRDHGAYEASEQLPVGRQRTRSVQRLAPRT